MVLVGNFGGGCQGARSLLSLGHRWNGLISGPHDAELFEERCRGYRAALEQSGASIDQDLIARGHFGHEGGEHPMQQLLQRTDSPTVVFACSERMAIGASNALWARGLRIPEDVSLVGFDDAPDAHLTIPPLTTIAQPIAETGRRTTEMLLDRIACRTRIAPRQVLLHVRLVERGSCARRNAP